MKGLLHFTGLCICTDISIISGDILLHLAGVMFCSCNWNTNIQFCCWYFLPNFHKLELNNSWPCRLIQRIAAAIRLKVCSHRLLRSRFVWLERDFKLIVIIILVNTGMHSSRMRTVPQQWPSILPRHASPMPWGMPPISTSRLWKHYLSATTVAVLHLTIQSTIQWTE